MEIKESNKILILNKFRASVYEFLKNYLTLHIAVIAYIIILTCISLFKYYSFQSSAWDLGIFNQACYTTLHGKIFYYTAELYANPGGSIFGVHFSPILFAVIPFYAIYPSPETLLIIQTVFLALGAYPTFFIAKEVLKSRESSLYLSFLYLLYPHLHSINLFDFHPDAFFVPLALFSYLFFIKDKWKHYFLFMFLSFLTKEFMPIMFIFFAIGEFLSLRKEVISCFKTKKKPSKKILILTATIFIAIIYYTLAKWIIYFFNPNPPSGFVEGTPWEILGVNLLNPSSFVNLPKANFFSALKYDFGSKFFYLITILAPLAFFPIFKFSMFLPVLAWIVLSFLSNYPPYYSLGYHYSAVIVPFSIIAAIEGLNNFRSNFKIEKKTFINLIKKIFFVGMIINIALSFLILPATVSITSVISRHDRKLMENLNWILRNFPNASILTQYDVFPYISSRVNSYVIPHLFPAFKKDYYFQYVERLFNMGIDIVILDINPDIRTNPHRITHFVALRSIEETGNYGLYASVDGILIYKWKYNGTLMKFEPFTIQNRYENEIIYDTTLFTYTLPPGIYNVRYNMKITKLIDEKVFTISIKQGNEILASLDVYGTDFENTDNYKTFNLTIEVPTSLEDVTFSVKDLSTNSQIYIISLEISIIKHL